MNSLENTLKTYCFKLTLVGIKTNVKYNFNKEK